MDLLFFGLAGVALISGALVVFQTHPLRSALWLIVNFFAVAGIYLLLHAEFIAAIQIIVYAGAIMVLFIFIVMMLEIGARPFVPGEWLKQWFPAVILGLISGFIMIILIWQAPGQQAVLPLARATPRALGQFVIQHYWFAVEIASLLLFVALVGAYYLGRKGDSGEQT